MHKMLPVRFVAAAALVGSVGFAIAMPGAVAGAKTKPPITTACSSLLGGETNQLLSGCVATGASKTTSDGVTVVASGDTSATIYWTNNKTTTETFSYNTVTSTCPTYLDYAATLEEQETATVTGGNTKLTENVASSPTNVCVYLASDGTSLVVSDGTLTLG
jgi:hypothetical protein